MSSREHECPQCHRTWLCDGCDTGGVERLCDECKALSSAAVLHPLGSGQDDAPQVRAALETSASSPEESGYVMPPVLARLIARFGPVDDERAVLLRDVCGFLDEPLAAERARAATSERELSERLERAERALSVSRHELRDCANGWRAREQELFASLQTVRELYNATMETVKGQAAEMERREAAGAWETAVKRAETAEAEVERLRAERDAVVGKRPDRHSEEHAALVAYLLAKAKGRDWHGVSDAANDLRVLEAQTPASPEEHARVGVACLVTREGDGALLIHQRLGAHGAGTWSVPGGHVDYEDASVLDAGLRELAQETGIRSPEVLRARMLPISWATLVRFPETGRAYVTLYVHVLVAEDTLALSVEPDKCIGTQWLKRGERWPGPLFSPLAALLDRGVDPWG